MLNTCAVTSYGPVHLPKASVEQLFSCYCPFKPPTAFACATPRAKMVSNGSNFKEDDRTLALLDLLHYDPTHFYRPHTRGEASW